MGCQPSFYRLHNRYIYIYKNHYHLEADLVTFHEYFELKRSKCIKTNRIEFGKIGTWSLEFRAYYRFTF